MTPDTPGRPDTPDSGPAQNTEYRIAHLRERLAQGEAAELGLRIEAHGDTVTVSGTVPTAACRDDILRIVAEELPGVRVRTDIALSDASPPDRSEELS